MRDIAGAWEEVSGCGWLPGGGGVLAKRPSGRPVYGSHTGSKQTQLELVVYFVAKLNFNSFLAEILISTSQKHFLGKIVDGNSLVYFLQNFVFLDFS